MSTSAAKPKTGRRKTSPAKSCRGARTGTRHQCDKCDNHFGTRRGLMGHTCKNTKVTTTVSPSQPSKEDEAPSTSRKPSKRRTTNRRRSKKSANKQKSFACPDCDKSYSFAHGLRAHRLIHTGEKPHECVECGKTFTQRSFLQIHTRTHTGEKPYECAKCGKRFRQPSHLRYHAVTHSRSTTRGRFQCGECGKRLRYQQSLRLHLRTAHAGDAGRPHKCEHCGKTFAERPKLRLHVRVHTGERPYACDLCGRSFTQKGNRDKHVLRYHARDSDRKFRCDQCPKAFIWKKCLGIHLQWHRMAAGDVQSKTPAENKDKDVVVDDDDDDDASRLLEISVSKLIPHLLDEEILTEIGWPSVGIDQVVVKVLRWCDQKPAEEDAEHPSSRFVRNVRTLLDIVLEEKFDEMAGLQGKNPHAIVEQLLKTIDNGT